MPPFSPSACASAASRNGIRRPIGRTNLPSRTSSANSRSLDGSGCVRTRAIFTVGFWAAALSGKTAAYPKEPEPIRYPRRAGTPCCALAKGFEPRQRNGLIQSSIPKCSEIL